tara:strand:- start:8289 stop:9161 length:873 start_codon:yes stop_codon:yes gene_type:complete
MTIPVTDLQGLDKIAILDFFSIELVENLHYIPNNIDMDYAQSGDVITITPPTNFSMPSKGDLVNLKFKELLVNGNEAENMIDTFYTVFDDPTTTSFKVKSLTSQTVSSQTNGVTFKQSNTTPPVPITYLFHNGVNLKDSQSVVWQGNTYEKYPCSAEGYTYSTNGALPRPKIKFSNSFGTITSFFKQYNIFKIGDFFCPINLGGAKITRHRTLAKHLDSVNFLDNTNPYGTPDPTAEFEKEIYFVERMISEDRDIVGFELVSTFDLVGVSAPSKLANEEDFPGIGRFINA